MPDATTNGGAGGTILHSITQHLPNINKFAGRINGACVDVDTFLESLDSHLDATNVTDQAIRLKEAKSFLDYSKGGDICSFTAGYKFKSLKTYDEFKEYIRTVYGRPTSSDTVKYLSKILRNAASSPKDYISFGGELYNELNSFRLKVETNPEWFPNSEIKVEDLCKLLHMSLVLAHLPRPLTESFKDPLKKTNDLATIQQYVGEYRNKIVDLDQSKLDPNPSVISRTIASVSSSPVRSSPSRQCKFCSKSNHSEPQCYRNPNFCGFHKTTRHAAKDCLALRNKFGRSRSRQRYPPQRYGYNQSGYNNNQQWRQGNFKGNRSPSNYRRNNRSNTGQNFHNSPQRSQNP